MVMGGSDRRPQDNPRRGDLLKYPGIDGSIVRVVSRQMLTINGKDVDLVCYKIKGLATFFPLLKSIEDWRVFAKDFETVQVSDEKDIYQ